MASISNWAWLPRNLLDEIIDKLVPISDCIRFSLVCRPWRSAAAENFRLRGLKNKRHTKQQLPLLMIPTEENSREVRGLYSVTEGRTYQHQQHVPFTKRFCGSSHGWLLAIDENMVISLLNPFSGAVIRLPAIVSFYEEIVLEQEQEDAFKHIDVDTDFQEDEQSDNNEEDEEEEDEDDEDDDDEDEDEEEAEDEDDDDGDEDEQDEEDDGEYDNNYGNEEHNQGIDDNVELNLNHEYTIHKAVLSKDPDLYPDDYAVMIIYGNMKRLAFIKSGDKNWTYLHRKLQLFSDIIYSKEKFLCLRHWGDIWSCDINNCPPKVEKIARAVKRFACMLASYLVELPKERELVFVHRMLNDINLKTFGFKVMKRQIKKEQSRWVETLDLGGAALFLGANYSTSVLASDYPGCRPNCIYFTDDYADFFVGQIPYDYCGGGGPSDNGFYDLKNGLFGKHYKVAPSQEHMPPPIWLIPKFQ